MSSYNDKGQSYFHSHSGGLRVCKAPLALSPRLLGPLPIIVITRLPRQSVAFLSGGSARDGTCRGSVPSKVKTQSDAHLPGGTAGWRQRRPDPGCDLDCSPGSFKRPSGAHLLLAVGPAASPARSRARCVSVCPPAGQDTGGQSHRVPRCPCLLPVQPLHSRLENRPVQSPGPGPPVPEGPLSTVLPASRNSWG